MQAVLVTGGAGFIGSHTAKLLQRSGFNPIIYDDLSSGHVWAAQDRPLIVGGLAQRTRLTEIMESYGVDTVIHFAASAYVGDSMADPRGYFDNNVVNTLNLLNAMLDAGVKRIVFSSTCATYGVPNVPAICEMTPQRPVSPYGESKLFGERMLQWYERAYGLQWVALRYFNAAGADPEGELGEEHNPETHVIPLVIQAAMGHRPSFSLFGEDYATPDGTAIRDFIHVADLAEAHLRAVRYLAMGGKSIALNLGTGQGYSVRQVINGVERSSGCSVPVNRCDRRSGDPPLLVADARRAKHVLGWQPERSDLDFIIASAWTWFARRQARKQPATVAEDDSHCRGSYVASADD